MSEIERLQKALRKDELGKLRKENKIYPPS
jgi:hypothetical protein